jgi:hypothetical protein
MAGTWPPPPCGRASGFSNVHVLPFQCSAGLLADVDATAVHAVAEVHDTLPRPAAAEPVGFGVFWIVQLEPFQASASVTNAPELFFAVPVAMQADADVHETPFS